jgi:hypothetical protein
MAEVSWWKNRINKILSTRFQLTVENCNPKRGKFSLPIVRQQVCNCDMLLNFPHKNCCQMAMSKTLEKWILYNVSFNDQNPSCKKCIRNHLYISNGTRCKLSRDINTPAAGV